uniref:Mediator of RNA polymerase II transcription subunit 15 n=1 Tax=Lepeophtheirus salmonis TaxID=72036 RepID=C1BU50_LEPSM|nr:Mediator of RNA polymerase II transcription subunit 15 [Lepeophtheirus salmonis]
MGGYPDINLGSHKRDDREYIKRRKELRKHVPVLKTYLEEHSYSKNNILHQSLSALYRQLTDNSIRVPMHVLIRGEDLLRRNVLGNMDQKNSIMEVVWRSQEFRLTIAQKIDETMQLYGNSIHKSSKESESFIYKKARNKNEYLESAARILLHLRERSLKNSTLSTSINCNSKLINETKLFPSVP